MSNNEDVTQFLTEGSVWKRGKGKLKGKEVRLLLLTNTDLIGTKAEEDHPVRVVYANEKNQIFDRTVDDFCSLYKFHNVDGELETRLERLLAFEEPEAEDEDEDEEDDSADEGEGGGAKATTALFEPAAKAEAGTLADEIMQDLNQDQHSDEGLGIKFTLSRVEARQAPQLSEDDLEQALVGYVQEPAYAHGLLSHRLTFRLGGKLTMAALREVFDPSETMNTVASFSGVIAGEFFDTVWTSYIGVFPEAIGGEQFAAVHVGTEYEPQGLSNSGTDEEASEPVAELQETGEAIPLMAEPAVPAKEEPQEIPAAEVTTEVKA